MVFVTQDPTGQKAITHYEVMKENDRAQEFTDLIESTNDIYNLVLQNIDNQNYEKVYLYSMSVGL